jgi:hypothetical protein
MGHGRLRIIEATHESYSFGRCRPVNPKRLPWAERCPTLTNHAGFATREIETGGLGPDGKPAGLFCARFGRDAKESCPDSGFLQIPCKQQEKQGYRIVGRAAAQTNSLQIPCKQQEGILSRGRCRGRGPADSVQKAKNLGSPTVSGGSCPNRGSLQIPCKQQEGQGSPRVVPGQVLCKSPIQLLSPPRDARTGAKRKCRNSTRGRNGNFG